MTHTEALQIAESKGIKPICEKLITEKLQLLDKSKTCFDMRILARLDALQSAIQHLVGPGLGVYRKKTNRLYAILKKYERRLAKNHEIDELATKFETLDVNTIKRALSADYKMLDELREYA